MPEEAPGKATGKGQPDSVGAGTAAEDLFRRVSGLGGFLIVAFVAPVGGSGQGSAMGEALAAVGDEASEINRELSHLVTSQFERKYEKPDE